MTQIDRGQKYQVNPDWEQNLLKQCNLRIIPFKIMLNSGILIKVSVLCRFLSCSTCNDYISAQMQFIKYPKIAVFPQVSNGCPGSTKL